MTWQSWTYVALFVVWFVVEMVGVKQGDRPEAPRTLSANIWWLVRGSGWWHRLARGLLVAGLGMLTVHLLG